MATGINTFPSLLSKESINVITTEVIIHLKDGGLSNICLWLLLDSCLLPLMIGKMLSTSLLTSGSERWLPFEEFVPLSIGINELPLCINAYCMLTSFTCNGLL